MSSVTVISTIVALIVGLVCYAFAAQTIQQKREQRKRLLAALKRQSRSFKFTLNGCPAGFLTNELTIILLRSLIDVSEQLTKLEPSEASHGQDLQLYTQKVAEVQRSPPQVQRAAFENLQQIKEVRMSLEELHRFVFNLEGQGRVPRNSADAYRAQIKQLVLQITVDGYLISGQQARQNEKYKLALHYYELAQKLLTREGKAGLFEQKIASLQTICAELRNKLENGDGIPETLDEQEGLDEQWDKFSSTNENIWKKKQVYD